MRGYFVSRELREGVDYTIENGCWIFTASFLLARGPCCKNGCRNCPYGFKKSAPASPIREPGDSTKKMDREDG
jgi:hypothetical protein